MDLQTINQRLASLKASLDALENATTVDARAAEALAVAQAAKASAEETLSGTNGATRAALAGLLAALAEYGITPEDVAPALRSLGIGSADYGKIDVAKLLELFKTLLPFILMFIQKS